MKGSLMRQSNSDSQVKCYYQTSNTSVVREGCPSSNNGTSKVRESRFLPLHAAGLTVQLLNSCILSIIFKKCYANPSIGFHGPQI